MPVRPIADPNALRKYRRKPAVGSEEMDHHIKYRKEEGRWPDEYDDDDWAPDNYDPDAGWTGGDAKIIRR